MSAGTIVVIVVVVIIVAALIAVASLAARRRRLKQRFGPEYDRAVEGSDSRRQAEAELAEREKRVRGFDLRPLAPAARDSYLARWTTIQQQFVDSPTEAVAAAQSLITSVMADRGYPTDDASQITADLSVDHAETLGHFRTAQDISGRVADGTASTEDLRQAMVHYRALFQSLLGDTVSADTPLDATEPVTPGHVTAADASGYPVTGPPRAPDYPQAAAAVASHPEITEPDTAQPDPLPVRPAGRHHADGTDPDVNGDASGGYAAQADLDDPDAEPAAASRLPWRK
jgi:Tfp pilus assembly protein PilX